MFGSEAINGYDPISYFTENKAAIGDKTLSYSSRDATWYFSTLEN
jgi:hypothetical protein